MRRILATALLAGAIVAVRADPALAELANPGAGTANVGSSTGSTVSRGSASFDSRGIGARSGSSTNQPRGPGSPGPPSSGPGKLQDQGGPPVTSLSSTPCLTSGVTRLSVGPCPLNLPAPAAPPAGPAGPGVSALQLAQQASANQPWPNLVLTANPGIGLCGLPTWFWLAGNPNMPDATASSGDLTVTVRAGLSEVSWDFGDGKGGARGLGRANQSDVQHTYETDSFAQPSGYTVVSQLRFQVFYSVNGGAFNSIGFKSAGYTSSYVVNQLQPQAVSGN
jgi:hypothetical protein